MDITHEIVQGLTSVSKETSEWRKYQIKCWTTRFCICQTSSATWTGGKRNIKNDGEDEKYVEYMKEPSEWVQLERILWNIYEKIVSAKQIVLIRDLKMFTEEETYERQTVVERLSVPNHLWKGVKTSISALQIGFLCILYSEMRYMEALFQSLSN